MSSNHDNDFKFQYKAVKQKLKVLIYENEFFQEELRKAQRSLLRVQRDKSFLLDRILLYQPGPESSTDSDETEESENEILNKDTSNKRKKIGIETSSSYHNISGGTKGSNSSKKKKMNAQNAPVVVTKSEAQHFRSTGKLSSTASPNSGSSKSSASPKLKTNSHVNLGASGSGLHSTPTGNFTLNSINEIQMSREEIERQLAARQPITDFPTTVSLTLPNQLFSDNLLEGDFIDNDIDTSPSNLEDDVTVDNFD